MPQSQVLIFGLPFEIITKIFLLLCKPVIYRRDEFRCIPALGSDLTCVEDIKIQPITPFFLGSICRTWRLAVWNTPILWSSIVFHPSDDEEIHSTQLQLLEEWIARSGACPLSISISADHDVKKYISYAWWEGPGPFEIYQILDSYAERWRDLEIIIPSIYSHRFNFRYHFPRISNHSPNLSSLSLRPPFGWELMWPHSIPVLLEPGDVTVAVLSDATPLLRNVTLMKFRLSDVTLPWSQLLSITTVDLTSGECMEILQRCSSLKHCRFGDLCTAPWGKETLPSGTLLLPNITSLEMQNFNTINTRAMINILQGCSCPELQEFAISTKQTEACSRDPNSMPTKTVFAIADFLFRSSSSSLLSLYLHISFDESPSGYLYLLQCFEAVQSLETLELSLGKYGKGLGQNFLQRFDPHKTAYPEDKVLLPNLQKFSYKGRIDFAVAELINVLKCRWEYGSMPGDPVRQLRSAKVEIFNGVVYDDDIRHLDELLNYGMDISVNVLSTSKLYYMGIQCA